MPKDGLDEDIEFRGSKNKEIYSKVNTHIYKVIDFTKNKQNIETILNKVLNELINKYSSSNKHISVSDIIKPAKLTFTSNYNKMHKIFEESLESNLLKKRILFWGDKDDDILLKIDKIVKIIDVFYHEFEKVVNNHFKKNLIFHSYQNQSKNELINSEDKVRKIKKEKNKLITEIEVLGERVRKIGNYPKKLKCNYIKDWNKYVHRINDYHLDITTRLRYLTYCNLMSETLSEIIEMKTRNMEDL